MTNIALVVLDTLRKDTFEEYFGWMPGVRYSNAWSTSGWTVPVHGSIFTGKYPTETGVYAKYEKLSTNEQVLAEILKEEGYRTTGFSANANISDAFDFSRGFSNYQHSWRGRLNEEDVIDWGNFISRTNDIGAYRYLLAIKKSLNQNVKTFDSLKLALKLKARDLGISMVAGEDSGARQALQLIENTDFRSKEFLFLNLMEVHTPYNPPEEYQTVELDVNPSFKDSVGDGPNADKKTIQTAYNDCARYLSDIYKEIFSSLKKDFDYIITLSDHGEMFGNSGIWGHNLGIHPELTKVPLSIYNENYKQNEHVQQTVSLLDVFETVIQMADIEGVNRRGRDLREVKSSNNYLVERHGLRKSRIEWMQDEGFDADVIANYDRSLYGFVDENNDYGWGTTDGLEVTRNSMREKMERMIQSKKEGLEKAEVERTDEETVSADIKDRLEELGYR